MAQRELHGVELQFMRDWDAGEQPSLRDYLSSNSGDDRELIEFVADYIVFEAMTPSPALSINGPTLSPS